MQRSPSANRHWFTSELDERTPRSLWARIVFGVVASLLVSGAAVAALVILADSTGGQRRLPEARSTPIQGALALRPDVIREARWPFDAPGGAGTQSTSRPPVSSGAPKALDVSGIELVHDFCHRLDTDPARAVALVSGLPAEQHARVVRAWAETESVRLRWVRARPDDSLVAGVVVRYPDGNTLDLRYRFTVRLAETARIVGAELLSARYQPGG